jgi:cell wall assembly regulator SMI1
MSERIDAGLIERVRVRIKDDWRRTGEGDYQRMPKDLRKKHPAFSGGGVMGMMLNAAFSHDPEPVEPLKPIEPLGEKAVAKVEHSLGFKLPTQLRQLYLEIGDGGFGPYWGVRRLSNWAKDYAKLRADMLKERGREWPEALLPIVYMNGKRICVDRDSGEVLLWTRPPKKASEKKWLASFIPQASSVEEWLERWVDTPTVLEDGPEGGWQPPIEELERREAVIQEQEAKRQAELEKARTFTVADLPPLADELLERIAARAMDPKRRTYMAGAQASARPFGLEDMEDELERNAQHIPGHAFAGLARMITAVGKMAPLVGMPQLSIVPGSGPGMVMMKTGAGGKLGAPATEAAITHADEKLGFALPEPLRQLYRIADGGFGPGGGLLSLANMISLYRKLTSKPQGPSGEPWPAKLLPIWEVDEEIGCLDLETGGIATYDPSRMQDIHGGYFRRSFAKEQGSLDELMERWLGSTSWADQEARRDGNREGRELWQRAHERNLREAYGDADPVEEMIAYFAKLTPEDRAGAGLPEVGWEDELRRRQGS